MFGVKDDELATRWVQLGVFSPIMRLHSGSARSTAKEPWRFGSAGAAGDDRASCACATGSALPAHDEPPRRTEGAPLVQPMYFDHPHDEAAYRVPNQFMFGTGCSSPRSPRPRTERRSSARCGRGCPPGAGSTSSPASSTAATDDLAAPRPDRSPCSPGRGRSCRCPRRTWLASARQYPTRSSCASTRARRASSNWPKTATTSAGR